MRFAVDGIGQMIDELIGPSLATGRLTDEHLAEMHRDVAAWLEPHFTVTDGRIQCSMRPTAKMLALIVN